MNGITLNNPGQFGQRLVDLSLEQGWQSLSKRDMDLLMFLLLELDGAIDRRAPNHAVARQLRVTPSRVASLRRDAYARWRPLVQDDPVKVLQRILKETLTPERLDSAARYASERRREDGFLALLVEHPDDRLELEQAIKEAGAIPVHERNREVVLVHYETLFELAEKFAFLDQDPAKIQKALKKLFRSETDLEGFLKKDIGELTWQDAREALNSAGAKVVSGGIGKGATALLKLAFPFLP